jgi:serine phosphatase RsbU (regulator of sigma subunit)
MVRAAEADVPAPRRTKLVTAPPTSETAAAPPTTSKRGFHAATILVSVVVLAITVAMSLGARSVHNANENRLLHQRVQQAGAEIAAELPATQTPLRAAAEVAEATKGDPSRIGEFLTPLVGSGRQFASAAVFTTPGDQPFIGIADNVLESKAPATVRALLARAARSRNLTVIGLFNESPPRIGYAITSGNLVSPDIHYIVYAEAVLPTDRTHVASGTGVIPISETGLAYALYLGSQQPKNLVQANTSALPITGRHAATTIKFGDNELQLVMKPTTQLGGRLLAMLPWLLLIAGILVAAAAAAMVERLVRQREHARQLADENASLAAAQRTVAQTLQHSLLPDRLPSIPGIEFRARYVAGVADIDIGGDWYDVMRLANGNVLFVVGDVSGRGLPAATIMASLRYAIRAYAAHGDDPAGILTKLSALISVGDAGHFATVLCAVIDVHAHLVTIANAGHPQPLLVDAGQARFISTNIGVPIGVDDTTPYASVTITVPPGATMLAYTDGLVERRGEPLDVGLQRLRDTASRARAGVDALMTGVGENLSAEGPADDVAILGVEWLS